MTGRRESWCVFKRDKAKRAALLYCTWAPLEKVIQVHEICMHPSQWTNHLWRHAILQYYCTVTVFQLGSLYSSLLGSSLTLRPVSTPMIREKWKLLLQRTDGRWVRRCEVTWWLLRDFLWGWPMCRWGGKDWVSSQVGLRGSPRNLVQVPPERAIASRRILGRQVEFWRQSWLSKNFSAGNFRTHKPSKKRKPLPLGTFRQEWNLGPWRGCVNSTASSSLSGFRKAFAFAGHEEEWWLPQNRWYQNGPDYVRRCKIHYRSMRGGKRYPTAGPGTINWQLRETVILESHFLLCIEIQSSWAGELNVFFSNLRELRTTSNPTLS